MPKKIINVPMASRFLPYARATLFLVFGYVAICTYVFVIQEDLMFFPLRGDYALPGGTGSMQVVIKTPDGVLLSGWFSDAGSEKTVLYFHGNGGNIASNLDTLATFRKMGYNSLAVDYRGYGMSRGNIRKEEDLYQDAEASYDFLISKGVDPKSLVVWGRSLGGAAATDVALNRKVGALVLESTFSSMDEMAEDRFWFLPVGLLSRYHFRNADKLAEVRSPVLVIHSPDDEIIGFSNGERLFEKASSPKSFLKISGTHNGGHMENFDKIANAASGFLNTVRLGSK